MILTDDMWLVYADAKGKKHYQPWYDLTDAGTLIDPDNEDDLEVIGWTTETPEDWL